MRGLLKILLGGFAAFMVLAIGQEWQLFSSAWFGEETVAPEIQESDRKDATATLRLALDLMGHLYRSGGDARFAERLPAGDEVVAEILADVDYLKRNHRRQDPELQRLEVVAIEPLDAERLEIRTRESWQVRLLWSSGGGEAEPARSETVRGKYLLVRGGQGWRVEGWKFDDSAAAGGGGLP